MQKFLHMLSEHYITLENYSDLSKSNFKDHYGDAVIKQCLGKIAEINELSAFVGHSSFRTMNGRID